MKKILAVLLALCMLLGMCACSSKATTTPEPVAPAEQKTETPAEAEEPVEEPEEEPEETDGALVGFRADEDYDEVSAEIYENVLGEFYQYYQAATEASTVSERYALMAIAEAKLLESGVFLPTTSQGGSYAITRFAPATSSGVKWGGDADRFETKLVTNEIVTSEDWAAMKEMFAELQGTGTYYEAAKQYLAEHGYTLKDIYNMVYVDDPQSWDVFTEWNATLYEPLCNTFDNLLMYDCEDVLQPALAESYEVSDDGLTYTFHLRKGVKWVDSQGREVADLVADDFVAGAQHLFDAASGIEDLWTVDGAGIVGATDYYYGESTDFSTIGIEAVDEYTVKYTLEAPCPYFLTMFGYTTFSPLCRSYYKSQGGTFSAEGDEYTSGDYGIDPDHIAYCGPYLVTGFTAQNSINFKANPLYWNKDNIAIKELNWLFDDASDPTKSYDDFFNGLTDGLALTSSITEIAKEKGTFEGNVHVSSTNATAYLIYLNLNRLLFNNWNDETAFPSEKTQEQVDAAYAAVNNLHFRRAMTMSLDRVTYNEQRRASDVAAFNLINSYTTGDLVFLPEDVTVDINGTATTFEAGTKYGEILQAQLDADEYPIKAWNPEANDGIGGSTGYDGWYNVEAAKAELKQAIEELAAEGIEISAENPIHLDYPVWNGAEYYVNSANVYKQCIESALDGCVVVDVLTTSDMDAWLYAEYYCYAGSDMNFDIGDMTGWSPDYGDPCSMLATFLPDYAGYCTMSLGIY